MSTCTEILELAELCISTDLENGIVKYEQDPTKFMAVGAFKDGRRPLRVCLSGEVTTDGINCSEFDNFKNYSFGLQFTDCEELEAIEKLLGMVEDVAQGFTVDTPVKDGKIYIKIPVNQKTKKFSPKLNIEIDPKKVEQSGVYRGQLVDIHGEFIAWKNLRDSKAGVSFKAIRIDFEKDLPKKKK